MPAHKLPQIYSVSQVEIRYRLGMLALRNERFAVAQGLFEQALAIEPTHARSLSGLGRTLANLAGQTEQTGHIALIEQADTLFSQARQYAGRDAIPRLDNAQYILGKAMSDPAASDSAALIERVRALCRQALEFMPQSAEAHALLGFTYTTDEDGDPRPGIRALNQAALLLPRDGRIMFYLAALAVRVGKIDDARTLLHLVLRAPHRGRVAKQAKALLEQLDVREHGAGVPSPSS